MIRWSDLSCVLIVFFVVLTIRCMQASIGLGGAVWCFILMQETLIKKDAVTAEEKDSVCEGDGEVSVLVNSLHEKDADLEAAHAGNSPGSKPKQGCSEGGQRADTSSDTGAGSSERVLLQLKTPCA